MKKDTPLQGYPFLKEIILRKWHNQYSGKFYP